MRMRCLNCKMEYYEHDFMIHLMSDEMFAADIATYLFELHKRIEEIEKRLLLTQVLCLVVLVIQPTL
jgi:hypothetical protein